MQMKEAMLMERDTRSHSPQALHKERERFSLTIPELKQISVCSIIIFQKYIHLWFNKALQNRKCKPV